MMHTAIANGFSPQTTAVSFDEIQRLLPQRYPMLMVDRVLPWQPGASIHALRNATGNDPILAAHFRGKAIVPGVLILEGVAQRALQLTQLTAAAGEPIDPLLGTARARFIKPVRSGDQLHYDVALVKMMGRAAFYRGTASVDGGIVADCEITVTIRSE